MAADSNQAIPPLYSWVINKTLRTNEHPSVQALIDDYSAANSLKKKSFLASTPEGQALAREAFGIEIAMAQAALKEIVEEYVASGNGR